ncbi:DUF1993 domain-containing protein [Agrobacterium vitis]|uniref:DUF1993 domain-containing protein n=1 Tax=Agrobacterium vitis TaxID=373 RepID=UPI003D2CFAE2
MSLTTLLVPTYIHMLETLSGLLTKAQKQLPQQADTLLSARLTPDMFPLWSQVCFVCFQAQEAVLRLKGQPIPETLQQMATEGRTGDGKAASIADAQAKIDEALTFLRGLAPDELDQQTEQAIALDMPSGIIFDMTGADFVRDWALPQFYFHIVTAYGILRNQKIEIGKADFVPHMFGYLRPGTVPQS